MEKEIIDAAALLKDCLKYSKINKLEYEYCNEDLSLSKIDISNSICYYVKSALHCHREWWSEENLVIFIRGEYDFQFIENFRSDDSHRKIYIYSININDDIDDKFKSILFDFMQCDKTVTYSLPPNIKFDYVKILKILELLAFS